MTSQDQDTERKWARLREDAATVVKAVQRDDCGQLVGQMWVGGNGGLLSNETLRAVDRLRLTLSSLKAEKAEASTPGKGGK